MSVFVTLEAGINVDFKYIYSFLQNSINIQVITLADITYSIPIGIPLGIFIVIFTYKFFEIFNKKEFSILFVKLYFIFQIYLLMITIYFFKPIYPIYKNIYLI
jgi:hypothetical protein